MIRFAHDLRQTLDEERRLTSELQAAYRDTFRRLVVFVGYCGQETSAHLLRMGAYVRLLATRLGLPEEVVCSLETASALHDVGKIGTPDTVFGQDTLLDPAVRALARRHTTIGEELLADSPSPLLELARTIAGSHHENWDGSGYPRGLVGEEIPLAGRVVKLADTYDTLRSGRCGSPPRPHSAVRSILLEGEDDTDPSHFAPDLLQIFRREHRRFERIWSDIGP